MTTKRIEKKNIIRLYAYYTPEITASTHLVNDLEKILVDNDFQIDCVTPTPSRGNDSISSNLVFLIFSSLPKLSK